MSLTVVDCQATTSSITIVFSDLVDPKTATSSDSYLIYYPGSSTSSTPAAPPSTARIDVSPSVPNVVTIQFDAGRAAGDGGGRGAPNTFKPGDWLMVVVSKVEPSGGGRGIDPQAIGARVNGKHVLKIVNCVALPSSVTVEFSEGLDVSASSPANPNSVGNYSIHKVADIGSVEDISSDISSATYDSASRSTYLQLSSSLQRGQWLQIQALNVTSGGVAIQKGGNDTFFVRVDGGEAGLKRKAREVTEAVEDAVAYPLLTEQVSLPSSAGGGAPSAGFPPSPSGAALGQIASKALTDALGWKANAADPKGFVGALTQSFTLTDVEGHVEATWTPRTYAVQTDLSGGITGAQASLYSRAKDALDKALPLLDGLYALDPEADPEDVKALREMARNQMNEIVQGLGAIGGPPVLRVNTYFQILLGYGPVDFNNPTPPEFDPDKIRGTLGALRDTYGISFKGNSFSNSIEDEQNITNFRIISDYMTSLLQSWLSNGQFFVLGGSSEAFFGTQLVLLSRQFSVISDSVEEVRFALDSVFISKAEQQTLLLEFHDRNLPAMFVDDMLTQIADLCREEGPRLLQEGGRFSVNNNILPVAKSLRHLVQEAKKPSNLHVLPDGYKTVRVQRALDDLHDQLRGLINLATPVGRDLPDTEPSAAVLQQTVSSTKQLQDDVQKLQDSVKQLRQAQAAAAADRTKR